MLPTLMSGLRALRASLLSKGRLSGPIHPQPKVISLSHDELPDYLVRDLGISDGNRSDRETPIRQRLHARPAGTSWARDARGGVGGGIVTMVARLRRVSHDHD